MVKRAVGVATGAAAWFAVVVGPAVAAGGGGGISVPSITATAPPGSGAILTVIGYIMWGATAVLILAVFTVVMKMATAHHNGRGASEHFGSLAVVLGCAILLGSASQLVNGLL
jgi:tellurite resistance protein TehA-like permease